VTVIEVLPNGNLLVSGEKQVALTQGTEYIRLSGVVNPTFITRQYDQFCSCRRCPDRVQGERLHQRSAGYGLAGTILPFRTCHSDQNHVETANGRYDRQIQLRQAAILACATLALGSVPAQAERIKDLASVQGSATTS
jgi:hypothetical protein